MGCATPRAPTTLRTDPPPGGMSLSEESRHAGDAQLIAILLSSARHTVVPVGNFDDDIVVHLCLTLSADSLKYVSIKN